MGQVVRILSLDGGGIRGLIPALVLAALEKRSGKPIAELFDLVAGTSTGSILALGLTLRGSDGAPKYTAEELAELYLKEGATIFSRSLWHRVVSGGGITDQVYPTTGIEQVLRKYFGSARLKDTLVDVLIPAYEIERRTPFFFRSRYAKHPPRPNELFDYPIWEVARSSAAAPTYFEPHRLATGQGDYFALVDGGVYANNPAMCALAEAKSLFPNAEIQLVSIGTGELTRPILYKEARDWGVLGWARPILDVVFDGVSDTVNFQVSELLGKNYHRFQTPLDEGSDDMDDASATNLRVLRLHADRLIDSSEGRIADLIGLLTQGSGGYA